MAHFSLCIQSLHFHSVSYRVYSYCTNNNLRFVRSPQKIIHTTIDYYHLGLLASQPWPWPYTMRYERRLNQHSTQTHCTISEQQQQQNNYKFLSGIQSLECTRSAGQSENEMKGERQQRDRWDFYSMFCCLITWRSNLQFIHRILWPLSSTYTDTHTRMMHRAATAASRFKHDVCVYGRTYFGVLYIWKLYCKWMMFSLLCCR